MDSFSAPVLKKMRPIPWIGSLFIYTSLIFATFLLLGPLLWHIIPYLSVSPKSTEPGGGILTNRNITNGTVWFLLEPALMIQAYIANQTSNNNKTTEEVAHELHDLSWRFDLTNDRLQPIWNKRILTMGVFAEQLKGDQINLSSFEEIARFTTNRNLSQNESSLTHIIFEKSTDVDDGGRLFLHLVVLHRVAHYLWVGSIPEMTLRGQLNTSKLHFGVHEQIFDPFKVTLLVGKLESFGHINVSFPEDIPYLLSQLPTSRYMHCPPERRTDWFSTHNLTEPDESNYVYNRTLQSVKSMKPLMRHMKMEFFLLGGPLLGWYRACTIIPYTTDMDFATWSKYAKEQPNLTRQIQTAAPSFNLAIGSRFGEPSENLELRIYTLPEAQFPTDIFFTYQKNETHYAVAIHKLNHDTYIGQYVMLGNWTYCAYPRFDLCSVDYLGYKLLAPCNAQQVIETESGPNWRNPVKNWYYDYSPYNLDTWRPYNGSGGQYQQFEIYI